MEQTIVLPIALGSKAFTILKKYSFQTQRYENYKINNITITSVTLWRDGSIKHYISGNFKYLPNKVYATREEVEKAMLVRD